MAIFLAGMILIGLQPGPSMVSTNLDVTYTIVWSLAIANVLGTALCILLAPAIAKVTVVRYPLVAPFMILVITFAAFQPNRSLYDLVALVVLGVVGMMLRRFGWPRPAFLIGFVLATQAERYLYQALQFSGWNAFQRPIVLIIGAIILLSVGFSMYSQKKSGSKIEVEGKSAATLTQPMWPQIAFTLGIMALFVFTFVETINLSQLGRIFPVSIAVVGMATAAMVLYCRSAATGPAGLFDANQGGVGPACPMTPLKYIGWLVGFVAAIALVGYFWRSCCSSWRSCASSPGLAGCRPCS